MHHDATISIYFIFVRHIKWSPKRDAFHLTHVDLSVLYQTVCYPPSTGQFTCNRFRCKSKIRVIDASSRCLLFAYTCCIKQCLGDMRPDRPSSANKTDPGSKAQIHKKWVRVRVRVRVRLYLQQVYI